MQPHVHFFLQKSIPNEMLFGLRYFERAINNSPGGSSSKEAFSWGEVDMNSFAKCILSTCHSVRDILSNEPRLLKIDSPTYILGEFHALLSFHHHHHSHQHRHHYITSAITSQGKL